MKKFFIIMITITLLIFIGNGFGEKAPETKIGLIPLDSRPCNTQYPEVLGRMANMQVEIPYEYLDNFLTPAKTENLWTWLNNHKFKKIIINTNQLINGGLIASRDPHSYANLNEKISRLEHFCRANQDKEIIVISILPRLLPSQFTHLWTYQEPLIHYAQQIDKNNLEGKEPPAIPKELPERVWQDYLSIYENTQLLVKSLILLTEEGLIDHYLIGQDDAEQFGLSNKIIRELKPQFNEKVSFVHGADELTMLALTRKLNSTEKLKYSLYYTNKEMEKVYFPFEAAPLEEVINTKLNYLNLPKETGQETSFLVHTDNHHAEVLKTLIQEKESSYLGIMDVAYTNKGDIQLLDFLFEPKIWPKVKGYAGWNTAGNTIGTELSHALAFQYLKDNFDRYTKEAQARALIAYLDFKYIRIAEDLIYQGLLRGELNERLTEININPQNIGENQGLANEILKQIFIPYEEKLNQAFLGEHSVGKIKFRVKNISAQIELPWSRTFEAKVTPKIIIETE